MKKKSSSKSLSIIPTASLVENSGVEPKPTKNEIVRAMVTRARQQWQEKENKRSEQQNFIFGQLVALAQAQLQAGSFSNLDLRAPSNYSTHSLLVCEVDITSPEIAELISEYRKVLKAQTSFDEKSVTELVRMAVYGPDRVELILGKSENVQTIDKLLAEVL